MTDSTTLNSSIEYYGSTSCVCWEGRAVRDVNQFQTYMHSIVHPRITDSHSSFEGDLRALATTGMETRFVEHLLASVHQPSAWEVGEALAECLLQDNAIRQVHWPWNTVRDRRTPRASLPGADLVGFHCEGSETMPLIGEVKTSQDSNAPPNVMNGRSGMVWQLDELAKRLDIQHALLRWLHARCRQDPYRTLYVNAAKRYTESEGKAIAIVGILLRDTTPDEGDLRTRANQLAVQIDDPTRVKLTA